MIKGGDDLRQEILAMQLIKTFKKLFTGLNIQLQPYEIIVTSYDSGLIGKLLKFQNLLKIRIQQIG